MSVASPTFPASTSFDVAVIGAGVFGAWTAWWLCRSKMSVVLIDAYGAASSRASSGGESRIIRMNYGPDEIYTRSSMRALTLWQEFFRALEQPLFHRTGVLSTARVNDPFMSAGRRTLEKCGVPFEALDAEQLGNRFPQIHFGAQTSGLLESDSGVLLARRAVQAVARETVRSGAIYLDEAVSPPAGHGQLASIRTANGTIIRAGIFVFACGPWLPKIFPHLLKSLISATRQEVFFFGIPPGDRRFTPPAMPAWIDSSDDRRPYGVPDLENRGLKLAFDQHGPSFDPDHGNRMPTPEGLAAMREVLAEHFPSLRDAPLLESRVCQYENTPGGHFLIDRHPSFQNVWLAGGGSGHGFKHGPAAGEYLAARILNDAIAEPRYSLFSNSQLEARTVH